MIPTIIEKWSYELTIAVYRNECNSIKIKGKDSKIGPVILGYSDNESKLHLKDAHGKIVYSTSVVGAMEKYLINQVLIHNEGGAL